MRVLVTGANGFVGRRTIATLAAAGHAVVAVGRAADADARDGVTWRTIGDLAAPVDWSGMLDGVDAIAHLAGVAHVLHDADATMRERYHAVNCAATLALARAAAHAGVRRFVFMSSVRVYGDVDPGRPFTIADPCTPADPYGQSKLDAEHGLADIARATGLEVVIVRPPLVYGPGVRANFLRLIEWVDRGVPLPLGAVHNRRSLIGVDNLASIVECVLRHPGAAGGTFLVSDGEDVSTPELIRRIAGALGRRARLLPVPAAVMRLGLSLLGRSADYTRLFGGLSVDASPLRERLGWSPVRTLDAGLRDTIAWYRAAH